MVPEDTRGLVAYGHVPTPRDHEDDDSCSEDSWEPRDNFGLREPTQIIKYDFDNMHKHGLNLVSLKPSSLAYGRYSDPFENNLKS